MGFRELAQNLAKTAFSIAGNIMESVTYTAKGAAQYDPETGETAQSSTPSTVLMMFAAYAKQEVDGESILATDVKGWVLAADLAAAPNIGDEITRGDETFVVQQKKTDPAGPCMSCN